MAIPDAESLRRKMAELRGKPHLPAEMALLVGRVAELQLAAMDRVRFAGAPEVGLPEAPLKKLPDAEARAQGRPLLSPADFPLDLELAAELAGSALEAVKSAVPRLAPLAEEFGGVIAADPGALEALFPASVNSRGGAGAGIPAALPETLRAWGENHPEAAALPRFIARSSIMPSLAAASRLLGGRLDSRAVWSHGHCPICGEPPLMGRLDESGARLHACSFCAYEYRAPRAECPFCRKSAARGADYYSSEEEPGYLLSTCPECRNYLKLADFRAPGRDWLPMLDDFASLALDFYAVSQGYARPTLSAWGF